MQLQYNQTQTQPEESSLLVSKLQYSIQTVYNANKVKERCIWSEFTKNAVFYFFRKENTFSLLFIKIFILN